MKGAAVAVAFALAACVDAPAAPHVVVVLEPGAWTADELERIRRGAHAWVRLGYSYELAELGADFGAPSCPLRWHEVGEVNCTLYVAIERVPGLHRDTGALGIAIRELRSVRLDGGLEGRGLQVATAHELGHVLLDTGEHLEGPAVMRGAGPELWPTALDFELACRSVGICVEP